MKRVNVRSVLIMRLLHRGFWVGALSVLGWLAEVPAPIAARSPVPISSQVAQAQEMTPAELQSYAQILLEIEPVRLAALQEIRGIIGADSMPQIACHRPDSLSSLNRNIRAIAVRYCDNSVAIVERRMPIQQFNLITSALERDSGLAGRIQQELLRLQN